MRSLTCLLLATFLTLLMPPVQAATSEPAPPVRVLGHGPAPRGHLKIDPPRRSGRRPSRRGRCRTCGPERADLAGGTVTFAATLAGRGVVVVDHGGVRTTYEPVSASVHVGSSSVAVPASAPSSAPRATASAGLSALGLLQGETYLDPLSLVGGGPIRCCRSTALCRPGSPRERESATQPDAGLWLSPHARGWARQ